MKRKKKIVPKSKDYIEDISDIILNAESDDAAIAFLQDSIIDDFPDLELGSMDLHEASKVLSDNSKKRKRSGPVVGLNDALGKFIEGQQRKQDKKEKIKRSQEKRRKHHRKKNKGK